jgi:asparagine synthetase B (glutamine-hydrolysing)
LAYKQSAIWDAQNDDLFTRIYDATRAAVGDGEHVGVVVSGGLDSSTVAELARFFKPDIPTFTGYYETPGFDERRYARLATDSRYHTEIRITPDDFLDHFDEFALHMPRPFQGMGAFGQYIVGKHLSERGIKVALSGEGSDELFGGYARLLKVARVKLPDGYENYQQPPDYPTTLREALDYDYARLPDLLAVDDACMAAWDVEARAPFTDERVVDFGLTLPPQQRVGKIRLKQAVAGVVHENIINRTDKKGFPIPLVEWANGPCAECVRDRIGYLPDPAKPWDRGFWYDLLNAAQHAVPAAA